jgi:hypothetical protein
MIKYKIDPYAFNSSEMSFYKELGIEVEGTAAHGSNIAQKTVPNYQIFSNFAASEYIEYRRQKYESENSVYQSLVLSMRLISLVIINIILKVEENGMSKVD